MKINIDYDGSTAKCIITEFHGHPDKFVDFSIAYEFSQIYALTAFKTIIEHWEKERRIDYVTIYRTEPKNN